MWMQQPVYVAAHHPLPANVPRDFNSSFHQVKLSCWFRAEESKEHTCAYMWLFDLYTASLGWSPLPLTCTVDIRMINTGARSLLTPDLECTTYFIPDSLVPLLCSLLSRGNRCLYSQCTASCRQAVLQYSACSCRCSVQQLCTRVAPLIDFPLLHDQCECIPDLLGLGDVWVKADRL